MNEAFIREAKEQTKAARIVGALFFSLWGGAALIAVTIATDKYSYGFAVYFTLAALETIVSNAAGLIADRMLIIEQARDAAKRLNG